jgi:hypothetical protein
LIGRDTLDQRVEQRQLLAGFRVVGTRLVVAAGHQQADGDAADGVVNDGAIGRAPSLRRSRSGRGRQTREIHSLLLQVLLDAERDRAFKTRGCEDAALVTRIGIRFVLSVGMALSAAGLVLYAQLPVHGTYFSNLFPAFILSGIGLAFAFVPMSIGALTGVKPDDAGVASGLLNTNQQIGGAIGVAIATTIATAYTSHYIHGHPGLGPLDGAALTHGFQVAFYVLAALAALAAVISAIMIEPGAAATTSAEDGGGELTPALEEAA